MSTLLVPSSALLRAYLKPSTVSGCSTQLRQASGYMPRSKYAAVTRLDKLHRTQKAVARKEKQAAIARADAISATFPASAQSTTSQTIPAIQSQTFPFTVQRTPSSNLPVYELAKSGGSKQITTIRKLAGDLDSLASQLRDVLKLPEYVVDKKGNKKTTVAVNRLTKQIVVRGWRGHEVKAWMEGVGF